MPPAIHGHPENAVAPASAEPAFSSPALIGAASGATSNSTVAVAASGLVVSTVTVQTPSSRKGLSLTQRPTPSADEINDTGPAVRPSLDVAVATGSMISSTRCPSAVYSAITSTPPAPSDATWSS